MTFEMLPLWLKIWCFVGLAGFLVCICPLRKLNPWNQWPRIMWFASLFGSAIAALIVYGRLNS